MEVTIDWARRTGACFKCNKIGHFAAQCPESRPRIRAIIAALDPLDQRAFAEEFRQLKESDFFPADVKQEEEEGEQVRQLQAEEVVDESQEEDFGEDHA